MILASIHVSVSFPMITSFLHLRHCNRTRGTSISCLYLFQRFRHLSLLPVNSSSPARFYLQASCGLSPNRATEKIANICTENIDKILNLLKAHGLSNTQITSIISLKSNLLTADPEKTIKPNMEVFASLEISGPELVKMARKVPNILESRAKEVVEIMKEYSLTNREISRIAKKLPSIFTLKVDKTLRPKLEYFKSSGFCDEEVRKLLSSRPSVLKSSLQRTIIPTMGLLREYLGKDANVLKIINRTLLAPGPNLRKTTQRNFKLLKSHGIPSLSITKFCSHDFSILLYSEEKLKDGIKEVIKLGIKPTSIQFMKGIQAMVSLTKESRERKLSLYRSFGLGDEDIGKLLRLQPFCMKVSEAKIKENLGFFINRLKMNPSFVGKYPFAVQLNMKKRILGRCAVMEILAKKGFVKSFKIGCVICCTEKRFAEKIIGKYHSAAPEIVKAHRGLIVFNEFPDGFALS